MAFDEKRYLDLTGLTTYDNDIKAWSNSVRQAGYKTVKRSASGNNLLFFKKPNAIVGTDIADETIDLSDEEAVIKLAALATLVGAVWDSTNQRWVPSPAFDGSISATTIVSAINEVISDFNTKIGTIPATSSATNIIEYIAEQIAATSVTGVKGNAETDYRSGNVNLTPANIGAVSTTTFNNQIGNHTVAKDVPADAKFTDTVYDDTALSGRVTTVEGLLDSHTVRKDVPANAKFTDTTYESKSAVSGGTDVSLVTTGEKYTWNNKANKATTLAGYGITDAATSTQGAKADTAVQSVKIGSSSTEYKSGTTVTLPAYPSKTSDLTNDSNFVNDAYYVHTDNNYTVTDKEKLAGIASGAEINQNAFSNVKVGNVTIAADSKTDTVELVAGSNVTLTPDASTDKITIAATDTTYSEATTSTAGLMSASDKTKLNGIASGAEVNQNAFGSFKVGSSTITADSETDTLEFVAGSNVNIAIDSTTDKVTISATDTTYSNATTSASGLMSASDKTKLNGIATGAEVNQNAFSRITVGSTNVDADSKTDALTLVAGSNVTITPDATNDKITIAATDTTYSEATTSAAGLMSASDKTKLNGIATGAEINQNAFSNVKVGSTTVAADGKTDTLELVAGDNITLTPDATNDKVTITAKDTTYSSKAAASGGTDVSLVTTGEKYTWNNKSDFDGAYSSLSGKPTLGTAAAKNSTDSYSASGTDVTTGKAVAAALGTLDVTGDSSIAASKTIKSWSETDGKVSITTQNISITKSQVSDFPTLGTAAAKNYTTSVTSGSSDLVTSGAVFTAIDNLPEPMVFRGSLGTNGTITTLPVNGSASIGDTYKVITAGTYASKSAKVGDTFICLTKTSSANTWELIPSGDEPAGTVTSVATGVGLTGGTITSSGTIKAKLRSETALTNDSAAATETANRIYPVVPDKSGYLAVNVPWTDNNTNNAVTQTATTTSADYEVLFSATADNTTRTEGARKNTNLKFNPSTGNLQVTQINGVTVGSSPKFTDNNTTYTFATGDSNGQIKVTPSGGSAQNVSVKGLGSAAYTASTAYATCTDLINEDLNNVTTPGFYNAAGGNSCSNKPSGIDYFGLEVIHNASGRYYTQIIGNDSAGFYRRTCNNGTWSAWTQDKYTDTNTWRPIGTGASDAAAGNHTHGISIATDSGTNQLTMTANTKYKITAGGQSYIFTTPVDNNTTYSSKSAASGGTDVSLVTTGEKYTWNSKAAGNHTHATSIATSTGTNQITLAANTKYAITAGGTSYVFTTPPDNNTWRGIQNNLTSDSTTDSLSAAQGKALKTLVDGKAASGHTHTLTIATDSGTNQLTMAANTKYKITAGGSSYVFTTPPDNNTNTTYTFANGTNGFTVTPSGGSAQTVTVTPSIANNVTGSGTSGYIAKWNGANTVTNGPAFGSATTTYLRNDGSWATPTDTKNTAGSTDTSSKIFLVGATSQAANPQTYSDNEIYATSGVLTTKSVQVGGTAATIQYNSTNKCIDFVFA